MFRWKEKDRNDARLKVLGTANFAAGFTSCFELDVMTILQRIIRQVYSALYDKFYAGFENIPKFPQDFATFALDWARAVLSMHC